MKFQLRNFAFSEEYIYIRFNASNEVLLQMSRLSRVRKRQAEWVRTYMKYIRVFYIEPTRPSRVYVFSELLLKYIPTFLCLLNKKQCHSIMSYMYSKGNSMLFSSVVYPDFINDQIKRVYTSLPCIPIHMITIRTFIWGIQQRCNYCPKEIRIDIHVFCLFRVTHLFRTTWNN